MTCVRDRCYKEVVIDYPFGKITERLNMGCVKWDFSKTNWRS